MGVNLTTNYETHWNAIGQKLYDNRVKVLNVTAAAVIGYTAAKTLYYGTFPDPWEWAPTFSTHLINIVLVSVSPNFSGAFVGCGINGSRGIHAVFKACTDSIFDVKINALALGVNIVTANYLVDRFYESGRQRGSDRTLQL